MGNRRLYKAECIHMLGTLEFEPLKVTALNLFYPTASLPFPKNWFSHIVTQPREGEEHRYTPPPEGEGDRCIPLPEGEGRRYIPQGGG